MRQALQILVVSLLLATLAVTARGDSEDLSADTFPTDWLQADYLLLGEVHDNAAGQALRLHWLQQLGQQHRVALAFEQFDLESQPVLEEAITHWKSSNMPADAAASMQVAEAAGFNFKGWKWPLYAPVVALALREDLPVAAANLSRAKMSAVLRGTRPAPPEPALWSTAQRNALLQEVREGHCNLMPEDQLLAMVKAQRARDFEMARVMIELHQRSGRTVVLLAGNGHLRNDLAVPVWLHQLAPQSRVVSVAILERGTPQRFDPSTVYNAVYWVSPEERPDPCEALAKRLERKADPSPRAVEPVRAW